MPNTIQQIDRPLAIDPRFQAVVTTYSISMEGTSIELQRFIESLRSDKDKAFASSKIIRCSIIEDITTMDRVSIHMMIAIESKDMRSAHIPKTLQKHWLNACSGV